MQLFLFSLNAVAPIFLMSLAGYFFQQIHLIDDHFITVANRFTFNACIPFLLFRELYSLKLVKIEDVGYVVYTVAALIAVILISMLIVPLFSKSQKRSGAIVHVIFRTNFVITGLALMENLYGAQGSQSITLLFPIIIPLYNIFAVLVLFFYAPKEARRKGFVLHEIIIPLIKNPMMIGIFFGIVFMLGEWQLPVFAEKLMNYFASISTPLLLICLGGQFNVGSFIRNIKSVGWVCAIKLLLVPLLVMLPAFFLGFSKVQLAAILIIFTSPLSSAAYIMARQMGSDDEFTALCVLMTTLLSPMVVLFLVPILGGFGIL